MIRRHVLRRMAGWNETTLRSAASWKAFKEGKMLLENGAVSAVKASADLCSGTVREGKRNYKVAVKVISPTHLETRCACPENQSTGALCAHGVAVALMAAAGPPAAPTSSTPAAAPAPPKPVGFHVALPVNWAEMIKRGRISATLAESKEIGPADVRIAAWLASSGAALKFPLHLNPNPSATEDFLKALAGHPRITVGKTGEPVTAGDGGLIELETIGDRGDFVSLPPVGVLAVVGRSWWKVDADGFLRLGTGVPDPELSAIFDSWAASRPAKVGLGVLLKHLGKWQEWIEFPEHSWLDEIHFVPARTSVFLSVDGSLQQLEATLRIRYESSAPVVPGLGEVKGLPRLTGDRCEVRDLAGEEAAVRRLENAGFKLMDAGSGKWILQGESAVVEYLSKSHQSFQSQWEIREGERFVAARKQVAFVEPKIEILGSGEDWMSFNLSFQANDGSVISMADVRRMLASGRSGSGKKVVVSEAISNIVEPLFQELDLRQEGGHFVASKRAGEVIEEIRKKIQNKPTENRLEQNEALEIEGLIQGVLRPYQTSGVQWLADRSRRFGGALLADDMGLGKTIQTIATIECLMKQSSEAGLVLVVATTSLLGNWKAEFSKFAPGRTVRVLHGAGREKEQEKVESGDVLLTSFGTLPRDLAWYLKQRFEAVVVDEASLMRNPDTDHAKAIAKLDAMARIALTGTPIENGVRDLWSIFRFIQPGWLGSREDFKNRYELVSDDPQVISRLRLKTAPFMLRRTKEEVAPDLPSKIFIEEYCDLSSEQQAVYRDLVIEGRKRVEVKQDSGNQGAARMQILTALLRLRQTCCDLALLGNDRLNQLSIPKRSAKMERLLELVSEAISGGHKILVFSQFQKQLQEIEKQLKSFEVPCLKLDGQTSNRQALVDRFQSPGGPPVFLISLKAGGYGLNLTAADIVVHFDPWWNPAAEAQATDRAHRIGQTRPVTVYRLITRGTVEEKVVRLQDKKRRLAAAIDEDGAGDAAGWSDGDLMDLMNG